MSKRRTDILRSNSSEYSMGYADGMNASYENSALDAYYAGVGYGKKASGDTHIGFNSDEERQQFEAGMQNKGKHFRAYRAEKPSLFERIFGGKKHRRESSVGAYKRHRVQKTVNRVKKKRSKKRK